MMNTTKIVFIGAGSASFGLSMFRDLFTSRNLSGSTLVLVDMNKDHLDRMAQLAARLNDASGAGMKIEKTTDRLEALPGAGFVVNSIAIDRNRLWKMDFEVPRKYGIRHTLGENGGPGGLFFTLRTIPAIMDIVRDMEALCPNAYFLNFSNPESRIILALGLYSQVQAVGLCHGVFMGRGDVARVMDIPYEQVDVWAAGMNHFQWLLKIQDHLTGADLYPLLRQKEVSYDPAFAPLTRKMFHAFGYWPTCSDDHLGEYLAYGWEGGEHGYNFEWDENERRKTIAMINAVNAGKQAIPEFMFSPSGERGVQIIEAILHNQKTHVEAGVVHNRGAICNLPFDCAVEVPIALDGSGLHPVSIGNLPEPIAALLSTQAQVQKLSVEAAMHASKELALQALLIDPVLNSITAAEKLLDELWEINQPYIRKCL
jgi:alpha-galactosidase